MNDDINRILKCLTLSVHENEITNLESLSWAINKLENFSMTFETLDRSRIGQTLQSVRHSKKISLDISGRIRNLIKCWRKLLDAGCVSVVPNEMKNGVGVMLSSFKVPAEVNGLKNGIIKDKNNIINNSLNGINHDCHKDLENCQINEKQAVTVNCNMENISSSAKSNILSFSQPALTKTCEEYININWKPHVINTVATLMTTNDSSKLHNDKVLHDVNMYKNDHSQKNFHNEPIVQSQDCINLEPVLLNNSNQNQENVYNKISCEHQKSMEMKLMSLDNINQNQIQISTNDCISKGSVDMDLESASINTEIQSFNVDNTDENNCLSHEIKSSKLSKPKLKSTKELLADFSNLIDNDTKNKILMDKITQEEDDPISYQLEELHSPEAVQQPIPSENNSIENIAESIRESLVNSPTIEKPITVTKRTKCDKLLEKFQTLCGIQPIVLFKPMIPWRNLKRGIDCSSPCIKMPKEPKRNRQPSGEPPNKITITDIEDLLQNFETRAQRKDMITEAIMKRKESQVVDNTQTLTDLSMKLTLKIQPKLPPLKIKKRKIRKKKKKKKIKIIPKPRVRKPRVKPKPPITNYLNDLPQLPNLTEDLLTFNETLECPSDKFHFSESNIHQLAYSTVEGYNCTKHTQTLEIIDFTKMYSVLIDRNYFHIFPWIDLQYSSQSMFCSESDDIIKSALDLPQLFS